MDLTAIYKFGAFGLLLASLLASAGYKGYRLGEERKQVEFDAYKENIHDQMQRAEKAKAKQEAEQRAKADMSQDGYLGALSVISNRLRIAEAVPRNPSVCVAGSGTSGVPREAADTTHTLTALAVGGGVCDSDFYARAMREHVQCHYLLELVK